MSDEAELKAVGKVQIQVQFPGTNDEPLTFSIKKTTPFSKVYLAVASNRGVDLKSFTLDFDGTRIGHEDTPKMLEMEDDSQVDYHMAQVGGHRP